MRRAGIEPACLSAPVFETDSYTCSGTCAYGTRRETRTPMPSRAPVPETGVSTDSTSRAYWYAERESNSQARYGRRPLRPMCLPFHHLRILAAAVGFEVRNELFAIPTPLETVVFPVSEAVLAGSNHARSDGYRPLTQPKGTIREQKIRPYMCLQRRIWKNISHYDCHANAWRNGGQYHVRRTELLAPNAECERIAGASWHLSEQHLRSYAPGGLPDTSHQCPPDGVPQQSDQVADGQSEEA